MATRLVVACVALLVVAACSSDSPGTDLPAHHTPTAEFPIAFDHPASWAYEQGDLVSAFPPEVLSEAPGESDPSVVDGTDFQGIKYLPGPGVRDAIVGRDDRVLAEGSATIDGSPATRIEAQLHDGGWDLHALLFVVDATGQGEFGLLFIANERSFDAAQIDAIAASARLGPEAVGHP